MSAVGIAFAFGLPQTVVGATVVVSPPLVVTQVPTSYVWDGSEYVGVVGGQYYYLGPGNVWIKMDSPRMHRFQGWEKSHRDWRSHTTRNVRYRNTGHGVKTQPMQGNPPARQNQVPQRRVNPGQFGP
ncbi:MAG: hypothetical protein ACREFR_05765 [Limisphaerales bacterium]